MFRSDLSVGAGALILAQKPDAQTSVRLVRARTYLNDMKSMNCMNNNATCANAVPIITAPTVFQNVIKFLSSSITQINNLEH